MLLRAALWRPSFCSRHISRLLSSAEVAMAPKRKSPATASKKQGPEAAAAADVTARAELPAAAAAAAAPDAPAAEQPAEEAAAPAAPPAKKKRSSAAAAKPPPGPVFDQSMRPAPLEGPGFRILTWNVAGLRALLKEEKKVNLAALAEEHGADLICLQETKLQAKHCGELEPKLGLEGWHATWNCASDKNGYSGTAVFSRRKPLAVTCGLGQAEHDGEGRVVTAEFEDCYVVNVYTPNSGDGLKRLDYRVGAWDKAFSAYVRGLAERKGVVVTGDLNCAHQEIDIHSPKTNLRSAGFTQEERDSFAANLLGQGFIDAFRRQYPGVVAYTYWGYRFNLRAKNKGWRLDYFLVSESLWDRVHECYHVPEQMGSDHCPLVLVMKPGAAA